MTLQRPILTYFPAYEWLDRFFLSLLGSRVRVSVSPGGNCGAEHWDFFLSSRSSLFPLFHPTSVLHFSILNFMSSHIIIHSFHVIIRGYEHLDGVNHHHLYTDW